MNGLNTENGKKAAKIGGGIALALAGLSAIACLQLIDNKAAMISVAIAGLLAIGVGIEICKDGLGLPPCISRRNTTATAPSALVLASTGTGASAPLLPNPPAA